MSVAKNVEQQDICKKTGIKKVTRMADMKASREIKFCPLVMSSDMTMERCIGEKCVAFRLRNGRCFCEKFDTETTYVVDGD